MDRADLIADLEAITARLDDGHRHAEALTALDNYPRATGLLLGRTEGAVAELRAVLQQLRAERARARVRALVEAA